VCFLNQSFIKTRDNLLTVSRFGQQDKELKKLGANALKTSHLIYFKNSTHLKEIPAETIDLMVTSPPYPMIEMWDSVFSQQNPAIRKALGKKDGNEAFELMHRELDKVWKETLRVLKKGGFACINMGDATRKIDSEFKLYANHSRTLEYCLSLGLSPLPEILWRKQTNAPNKFMGSGMLPAGAYVTLEHEHILILRKGPKREFRTSEEKLKRLQSAFFWEERNVWFSDVWEDLKGTKQNNINKKIRERSGAYPFDLPYRIINMFSLREDTVLDPFLGTGTTMAAAMATARNSIGFEIDTNFKDYLGERFQDVVAFSNKLIRSRMESHLSFVQSRERSRGPLGYSNKHYGFPVMTSQETEMIFDELDKLEVRDNGTIEVNYRQNPSFSFGDGKLREKNAAPLSKWIQA
jgi:DNA modification methylase